MHEIVVLFLFKLDYLPYLRRLWSWQYEFFVNRLSHQFFLQKLSIFPHLFIIHPVFLLEDEFPLLLRAIPDSSEAVSRLERHCALSLLASVSILTAVLPAVAESVGSDAFTSIISEFSRVFVPVWPYSFANAGYHVVQEGACVDPIVFPAQLALAASLPVLKEASVLL